ncbi:MAG TPA: DUF5694 domain-containing protein [Gemmatimonadaceae bacterium]|nr:DUF5694 domain-containing protein [Gemmatimonadaceae bacterium]
MRSESHTPSRILLIVLATSLFHLPVSAQAVPDPFGGLPKASILLVGTFHFDDPGLDDYKPQFPWNPLEPRHQEEIAEVVRLLAIFRPTRIAVEWPIARQAALDSAYRAFVSGQAAPSANEREQLGFRLARELGHNRVYAIDAPARAYDPGMTQQNYDEHVSRLVEGADPQRVARQEELARGYEAVTRFYDSLKVTIPLRDYLLRGNDPGRVLASHGQYLIGSFYLGRGDDYLGPDMRTRWYNRNLRIVHNIQRITRSSEERILVIIGSGHLPILRHALEASPEYLLVEVSQYLGRP